MGLLNAIQGDRVYLDTNIWIYAFESFPVFTQALTALFHQIDQGHLTAVTSELSLAEALVKAIQNQDIAQQETFKQAISTRPNVLVVPIQRNFLIEAARLRAVTSLKLPDTIHAATALATKCSTFLTNDRKFRSVSGLSVVLLSQAILPQGSQNS